MSSRKRKGVANIEPSSSGTAAKEDQEEEYSVEKVLDKRTRNNVVEYLLKWSGYDEESNTWEPRENLSCKDLIKEFEKKLLQGGKKRKRNEKIGRGGRGRLRTLSRSTVATSCSSETRRRETRIETDEEIENIDTVNDISDSLPILKIPEKIMGTTVRNGRLVFLMKWRGIEKFDLIPAKEANLKYSQIVIKYYEEKLHKI
ncbi:chromobox protein homolog 5-like [Metopolophium dirhodum]|uniref:chromobox protein homolog 5-like n=1 Tax=Metopolophium dirhodum TaxID=44670 RepID=UPI0029905875|nr:chromobox protein homolog 5-like [Metopolophium dirhodum]